MVNAKMKIKHSQSLIVLNDVSSFSILGLDEFCDPLSMPVCTSRCRTLIYAVTNGVPANILRQLINQGCDVNAKDANGKTALMYAMARRDIPFHLLKLMVGHDVNAADREGVSILVYAVKYKQEKRFIQHLLHSGAKLDLKDVYGKTVLDFVFQCCPYKSFALVDTIKNPSWLNLVSLVDMLYPYMSLMQRVNTAAYFVNQSGLTFRKLCEENKKFLKWMLSKCIVPKAIVPKAVGWEAVAGRCSPILSAVMLGHLDAVQYLLAVGCLTNSDLTFLLGLLRNQDLRITVDMRRCIEQKTSQPWPLIKLSLLAVSTSVGNEPDRISRVRSLHIPTWLQDILAYAVPPSRLPHKVTLNISTTLE
ncbi:uncharacterized protein LOC129924059 [Biomphalaria glabrata]|uniref:Uncharacterized protein LOC129924059 n=1 Tax=Biomphalaria glabrata TaxID=6526 RepID=A0A9W2ZFM7_BIOGL|nr:uncharacterized protein LOC129924059 [Biomphalaria glabrata]